MYGKIRHDKIINDYIRNRIGVTLIVKKMVETQLRWFEHAKRRHVSSIVIRVGLMKGSCITRGT